MTLFNKIKWIAGILLIITIVLTTNLIDRNNFSQLKESVTSIYEDRVVASDIIFEITLLVQEKEIALATSDSSFFESKNQQNSEAIRSFMARYAETNLTGDETKIFNKLQAKFDELEAFKSYSDQGDIDVIFAHIDDIMHLLYDLSKVQLKEGKRQMLQSNKTMESIDLFTQIEIIFMIIMAIFVQVIILYRPKED